MGDITTKSELYDKGSFTKDNDFIGFTFGGVHSSTLGIVRTSNGSRFDENLLPTIQDKTAQVPGGDGTYYFGSYYTQRVFNVSFAFDSLTENNFRKLKQLLGDKKIKELIFDEAPYKVYRAKITSNATIKHICFNEEGNRVYKGEGSIQFTCYDPFAYLRKESGSNTKEFYALDKFPTRDEWIESSGILTAAEMNDINVFNTSTNVAKIYNPGDLECDFSLTIKFVNSSISLNSIWISDEENHSLSFSNITQKSSDYGVKIDSKTNLIYGIDKNGKMTGTTYNESIMGGHFFKIPICEKDKLTFNIDGDSSNCILEYRLRYF